MIPQKRTREMLMEMPQLVMLQKFQEISKLKILQVRVLVNLKQGIQIKVRRINNQRMMANSSKDILIPNNKLKREAVLIPNLLLPFRQVLQRDLEILYHLHFRARPKFQRQLQQHGVKRSHQLGVNNNRSLLGAEINNNHSSRLKEQLRNQLHNNNLSHLKQHKVDQ